jgi:hypothetical protein
MNALHYNLNDLGLAEKSARQAGRRIYLVSQHSSGVANISPESRWAGAMAELKLPKFALKPMMPTPCAHSWKDEIQSLTG